MRFAYNAGQVKNKVSVNQVAFENACMGHHHQRIVELEQQSDGDSGSSLGAAKPLSRDEMESELARLKSLVISARSGTSEVPFSSAWQMGEHEREIAVVLV